MFIRSERLFLRPGWPEDRADIHAAIGDEAVVRNLALVPLPYTVEDAGVFAERPQDRRFPHFMVTLPGSEGSRLIGGVGIHPNKGEAELGYWIARDHWNCGYATEAARAVLALARSLGHRQIVAGQFVENPASGRVLRKVGFCPTGEIRPRRCLSRGVDLPAAIHTIELGKSSDCDGGDDHPVMRAA